MGRAALRIPGVGDGMGMRPGRMGADPARKQGKKRQQDGKEGDRALHRLTDTGPPRPAVKPFGPSAITYACGPAGLTCAPV
jgi:hypothetical protein